MKLRVWLQSYGIAALVLFPFYYSVIDRPADVRMHAPASVVVLVLALVANLVLLSLVLVLLAKYFRGKFTGTPLKFVQPALILASLAEMVYIGRRGWLSIYLWIGVLVVVLLLTLLFHWRWRRGEKLLFQLSSAALIGLGFFGIFASLQLLYLAIWHPLPNSTHEIGDVTNRPDRPRTVWILFDELSYDQAFGDRYPNLQLPVFDELRNSSTLFTDVQPVAYVTEEAVPSILSGQIAKRVSYTTGNRFLVGAASGPLHAFDAAQTPFAVARRHGLTTGIVGWFNPYCGLVAPYLSSCYWTDAMRDSGTSRLENFGQFFVRPWLLYGTVLRHPREMVSRASRLKIYQNMLQPPDIEKMLNAEDRAYIYQDLMRHAVHVLQSSDPDFVLLHLPVPHPPGFYNRKTGKFDTSGNASYIDNLALMDKTLGQLLDILKKSPRWKNTNVVINGDHSWRVPLWARSKYWTPEDDAASHGAVFDPRPLLMVHLAGQTTPATVNGPFPLLKLHDILDDLASGQQPDFSSMGRETATATSTKP